MTRHRGHALVHLAASPIFRAVHSRPLPETELQDLRIRELLALRDLAEGCNNSPAAWRVLAELTMAAIELARAGIGAELLPLAAAAEDALVRTAARPRPMCAANDDVQRLRDLLDAHDEQRRIATRAELLLARIKAMERLRPGQGQRATTPSTASRTARLR